MRKHDNKGFTLIEVLLSITIIALLFVPILNSFVDVAKVNLRAKQEQKATTCAQNVLESLKTMTLEETAIKYSKLGYPEGVITASHNFTVFPAASVERTTVSGILTYSFNPPSGRDVFSFVLGNVEENGIAYDALVTLDTGTYRKYTDTMNNYKMPKLLTINENVVAIIDMDKLKATSDYDNEARAHFKSVHASYVNRILAMPTPIPSHSSYTDVAIDAGISKNIIITLTKDTLQNEVDITCSMEYTCFDLDDNGTTEKFYSDEIYEGTYSIPTTTTEVSNIYVFYKPSAFATADPINKQDTITINNDDAVKANIYIAYQAQTNMDIPVTIKKLKNSVIDSTGPITVFANFKGTINSATISSNKLYEETTLDCRIYKMTVTIYPKGTIAKNDYSHPYVSITSVKEE